MFGAPADDSDHASNAARAALGCRARLDELNRDFAAFRDYKVAHRWYSSGGALVGNIGSWRRFNYSVMSDAVNVASRLEGANKYYGTTIAASEMTVVLTGSAFAWRELDAIRVKGPAPVKIYELLAAAGQQTPQQVAFAATMPRVLRTGGAANSMPQQNASRASPELDKPSALFSQPG